MTMDLFAWRSAVVGEEGPASPTTRHVLLTLSLHMNQAGGSCFPSTRTLASETALSRRAVESHLSTAEDAGWIRRKPRSGSGQGWRRMEYIALLPKNVAKDVPHVSEEGGEAGSPRLTEGGEPDDTKVGNVVPLSTTKNSPDTDTSNSVREMWSVYVNKMDAGRMTLNDHRRKLLRLLWTEQLEDDADHDPLDLFTATLDAVRANDFIMGKRAFQEVDSLFRNESKRERWANEGRDRLNGKMGTVTGGLSAQHVRPEDLR